MARIMTDTDIAFAYNQGRVLKILRTQRGLSQKVLSEGICTQPAYSNYENGRRVLPLQMAARICERLGITVQSFLKEIDL
jgi:transcriptional regulator with XRE-family HTH domain